MLTIAAGADVKRPAIVWVAHIALETNDMGAAKQFYGHVLGFSESIFKPEGGSSVNYFKVNDHQ